MSINAKYVHTNLTSRDWRRLVKFYCDVFGCVPKPPERDLSGIWLDTLTALKGAHLVGMHLLLPGYPPNGPTLEIFGYDEMVQILPPVVNQPGYGHLAFSVDDVDLALRAVITGGGSSVGSVSSTEVEGVGTLRVVYARDPEGNILELQKWN